MNVGKFILNMNLDASNYLTFDVLVVINVLLKLLVPSILHMINSSADLYLNSYLHLDKISPIIVWPRVLENIGHLWKILLLFSYCSLAANVTAS